MNCSVIRNELGFIQDVLTQTGEKSSLYYDLLVKLNDPEAALQAYALTLTQTFNSKMENAQLNEQGEHTLATYEAYTQSSIKPGVKELFESNSELANDVYKALGFETFVTPNKIVSINNTNYGDETPSDENELSFNLKDIEIEQFNDIVKGNKATVYFSVPISKTITFGKRANNTIAQIMLHKNGNIVSVSSVAIYSPNVRVGKNQLKVNEGKGIGKYIYELLGDKLLNEQGLILKSDVSMSIGAQNVWKYLVKNNKAKKAEDGRYYYTGSQITPQQKQQAQQQYSQYLDTVFPDNAIVYRGSEKGRTDFKTRGFFTEELSYAKEYAFDKGFTAKSGEGVVNTFLINTSNVKNVGEMNTKSVENESQDSVLKGVDKGRAAESGTVYATTSKNLYELGTKQDIEGFKEHLRSKTSNEIGFKLFKEVENWQFHGSYPAYDFMDDEIIEAASQATTRAQKKALQAVQNMHNQVIFDEGTHSYSVIINNEVVPLTSVSKVLQSDIRFKFEGESDPNSKSLMWGNIADTILSGVITGKSKEEISNILAVKTDGMDVDYMTDAVKDKLYDEFTQFYEEQKAQGNLVLTQVRTFNSAQQVAGTLDILIIQPDGTTKVIDLKTSKNKFTGSDSAYKVRFPSTSSDLSESERGLKILKASTFDKHSAQMSIYSAMLGGHRIKLAEEEKLRVLPITIIADDNLVTDIEREVPFIEAKKFQEFEDMYGGQTSLKDKDTFTKIVASLSNILSTYKKEGRVDDAYQLEKFINELQELDYGQAIITYINEVYEEIMGTNKSTGLKELLQASLSNLQDDDANVESILNNIVKIEQILNQYSPAGSVLDSLKTEAIKSGAIIEKGSYLEKLFTVIDNIAVMRQSIQEELPSALAQYLVSSLPTGNDAVIKQEYLDLLEKQKKLLARGKSDKAVQEEIIKLEQQFGISKTNQDVNLAKVLEQEIRDGGYIDIGILDRWLESPMQLPVAYLSAFALKTKQEFEAARQEMIKFIPDLDASFQEFVKGKNLAGTKPQDLYKNFYEELTITVTNEHGEKTSVTTSGFVNPIDYNRYETEKMEMLEETSRMSIEDAARVRREWYARNSQARPTEDVRDNNVVLIEGLESIYARKRRQFAKFGANAEKNFQLWKKDNTIKVKDENGNVKEILTGELAIPNTQIYINPRFTALQQNKQDYKYYLKLLGTYFESQSKQPQRSKFNYERYKYMLPNVSKSELDRLTENGAKNLVQYKAKDLFQRIDDDLANENFNETGNRSLNVLFFNKSKPMSAQDISYDLTSSIIRYKIAADRFEKQQKLSTIGELLYSRVSKVETAQVSPSGIKKVKNYINAMTGAPAVATEKANNAADLLLAFLETQIYNITRKDPVKKVGNKTFDIGKIVDTLISFGGVSTLGADITAAIANSLQANVMTMVEAGAKKFFSPSTVAWSHKTYLANEGNFISDSWESYPRSLLGQLIEIYDPMQGDYFDNIGRKIGKTALKQKGNIGKLLMSGMRKGEHRAAVTLMLSVLKETQVKQGDKTISLADAYELDKNGRIKLKDGVELNNKLGLADADAQNKLHSISNRIFGIYNRESSVDALRYAIGRAALMFRKFLPQGIKYRFGGKQYNFQMIDFTRGMYRDFYKNLFTNTAEIKNMIFNPDETALTPTERENIQRAAVEHAFIMLTGLIVLSLSYILEGEDDDDPEVQVGKWVLYQTLRLNNELSTYAAAFNPATRGIPSLKPLTYSFSNVSAIFNVLSKATNLFQQVAEDIFTLSPAVYERDTGIWEKGDSKSLAALMKLLGINNRKIFSEPDEAISTLILQRGASK